MFGLRLRRNSAGGTIAVVAVALAMVVTLGTTASAVHEEGLFELDGNPTAETAPGDDWETLMPGLPNPLPALVASTAIPIVDADAPTDTSYFSGGGSKDVRNINQWKHSDNDVAPDKDEILNAFAAAYRNINDELIVYFGADRFSNGGDAAIGFWFFHNPIAVGPNGTFTGGNHVVGDILILSDFSGGGKISTVKVYEWVGTGGSDGPLNLIAPAQTTPPVIVDCQDPNIPNDDDVCATVNSADGTDAVWPYTPKQGAAGAYPKGSFYEGGVNISEVLPEGNECFSSFLAETRSSTSVTAQLKDFALGSFPVCAPSTELTTDTPASVTVHFGGSATFTFTELNNGDVTLTSPTVTSSDCTITPVLNTAGTHNIGDTNPADGKLQSLEAWKFRCTLTNITADKTITVIGSGVDPAGRTVTFCEDPSSPPPNTICDQDEDSTASVDVIAPSTILTSAVTATFTFTERNDGDVPLTNPTVTVTGCSSAPVNGTDGFNTGDTANKGVLDPGESWLFRCTVTLNSPGTTNVQGTGSGVDPLFFTVTFCATPSTPPAETFCDQQERAGGSVSIS